MTKTKYYPRANCLPGETVWDAAERVFGAGVYVEGSRTITPPQIIGKEVIGSVQVRPHDAAFWVYKNIEVEK